LWTVAAVAGISGVSVGEEENMGAEEGGLLFSLKAGRG